MRREFGEAPSQAVKVFRASRFFSVYLLAPIASESLSMLACADAGKN